MHAQDNALQATLKIACRTDAKLDRRGPQVDDAFVRWRSVHHAQCLGIELRPCVIEG